MKALIWLGEDLLPLTSTPALPVVGEATMEGVVRPPSAFSMTLALLPSMTATQELVVPRSIPIAFAISCSLFVRVKRFRCIEGHRSPRYQAPRPAIFNHMRDAQSD